MKQAVCGKRLESLPADCKLMAADGQTGKPVGFRKEETGTLLWFGLQWDMCLFVQAQTMERLLASLDAEPTVAASNRNLFTSLLAAPDGRQVLFIMNLYSGAQSTEISLFDGAEEKAMGRFDLAPMEVRIVEL